MIVLKEILTKAQNLVFVDPCLLAVAIDISSSGVNQCAISLLALSTASEPWQMFLPISIQKSPRIIRPMATTLVPSQTMAQTGPEIMYCTRAGKKEPEYARVCESMPEYARVCQSMQEYARVCQSMPEYTRV